MSVPAFTSVNEVLSHLNAANTVTNGNYAIFGLPVAQSTVQAMVDHANKYIYSLVPSLTGPGCDDPREVRAELAALANACVGTLVAATGGFLTGAFDYRLGDIFVTKGQAARAAFAGAIAAFAKDGAAALANLSTVSLSVNSSRHIPHYVGPELEP